MEKNSIVIKAVNKNVRSSTRKIALVLDFIRGKKADVAILTAEEVRLFGLITLGMNYKKTIKACKLLGIKDLFITGNDPKKTKGFISNFLTVKPLLTDKLSKKFNLYYKAGNSVELNNRID